MKNKIFSLLLLSSVLFGFSATAAPLTTEQQQIKQQGINYYMIQHCELAEPLLKQVAEAGDKDSQYYYADCRYQDTQMLTDESAYWYQQAAEQGDIYAMMRLSGNDRWCKTFNQCPKNIDTTTWRNKAKQQALAKAKQGDGEAMLQLYLMTDDIAWLEKGAAAGDPVAQYTLGRKYHDRAGNFATPELREAAVAKWTKASAEQGYPKAMYRYAYILSKQKKIDEAQQYLIDSVNTGYVDAIFTYAIILNDGGVKKFNIPQDLVKSYALFSLLISHNTRNSWLAESSIKKISLSKEQIEQAKAYAEQWQKEHPPLSEYYTKYHYPAFH
ncbi:hypothetical protein DKL61_11750 [Gammaproteobacteria bacterium ESL0073]|nr:hypothetical protein DKL61_11750 [Gammaproteobacteria bacterium ESL0073]